MMLSNQLVVGIIQVFKCHERTSANLGCVEVELKLDFSVSFFCDKCLRSRQSCGTTTLLIHKFALDSVFIPRNQVGVFDRINKGYVGSRLCVVGIRSLVLCFGFHGRNVDCLLYIVDIFVFIDFFAVFVVNVFIEYDSLSFKHL